MKPDGESAPSNSRWVVAVVVWGGGWGIEEKDEEVKKVKREPRVSFKTLPTTWS